MGEKIEKQIRKNEEVKAIVNQDKMLIEELLEIIHKMKVEISTQAVILCFKQNRGRKIDSEKKFSSLKKERNSRNKSIQKW